MKEITATGGRTANPRLRRIEGRHNTLVKDLRRAFSRGELTSDGYCAIEGFRILEEAIRSGLRFRAVFFSESAAARAENLLSQLGAQVETLLLPDKLFASAVPSDAPQGVAALARWKEFSLEDVLAKSKAGPLLAIAGVQDPGNLGTILRSAEAFGAGGVLLGEGTVSPFNPKVVRASAGSVFRLPVARAKLSGALGLMKNRACGWWQPHRTRVRLSRKPICLGRWLFLLAVKARDCPETSSKKWMRVVAIPQAPQVESLNVGVATSIVLYEVMRQRQ